LASPAVAAGSINHALISQTVTRLSWMFTQPSSSNTQIGFGMAMGAMRQHLTDYATLYLEWFGREPGPEHLYAAGTVISNGGTVVTRTSPIEKRVSEENFSRLWSVAQYRLKSVPSLAAAVVEPFPETRGRPVKKVKVEVARDAGDPVTITVDGPLAEKLADLAWCNSGYWLALDRAVRHLWDDFAFIRERGYLKVKADGSPPSPSEAWRLIKRKSAAGRKAWARTKLERDRQAVADARASGGSISRRL
jgi:hypothetical protein